MKKTFSSEQNREFARRHALLVDQLHKLGIGQYLVTQPDSIYYLTGASFEALERPFFLLIDADGGGRGRRLLVPVLEFEHMQKCWGIDPENACTYQEYPAPAGASWQDALFGNKMLASNFAFEDSAPHAMAALLAAAGGQALDLVGELRMVKSDWEVSQVERAAAYADWGVNRILNSAYRGVTVAETHAASQQLLRKIVRETPDWDALATKAIGAAWPAPVSAEPHSIPPVGMRLDRGPHVAMVLTRVNGYAAESERTFFTVPPSAQERELFQLMEQARKLAFSQVRPGIRCAEIDESVNAFLAQAGFGNFHTRLHRCGHGIGLGTHEAPWLASGGSHVLAKNMVISIEPGIYLSGVGGFRHSDTLQVTEKGYRLLTHAPDTLADLVRPRASLSARSMGWLVRRSLGLNSSGERR
jgi:Xaa-Pro dipeptidase